MALRTGRRRSRRARRRGTRKQRSGRMTALMRKDEGDRPILITGGAGFIGCNIASTLVTRGDDVLILDSLARPGARENAHWLKSRHGDRVEIQIGDIRDREAVNAA